MWPELPIIHRILPDRQSPKTQCSTSPPPPTIHCKMGKEAGRAWARGHKSATWVTCSRPTYNQTLLHGASFFPYSHAVSLYDKLVEGKKDEAWVIDRLAQCGGISQKKTVAALQSYWGMALESSSEGRFLQCVELCGVHTFLCVEVAQIKIYMD